MNKNTSKMYKQCKITRDKATSIVWVPINLAHVGKTIVVENTDPAIIKEVYDGIVLTHKQLTEYYQIDRYGESIIYQ